MVWRGLAIEIGSYTCVHLSYLVSSARTAILCVHFIWLLLIIVAIISFLLNLALQVLDSSFMYLLPCVSVGLHIFKATKW